MPFITFKPSGKKIKAGKGDDLINIIKEAGIDIDFPCGGKGTCGRCIVKIESGKVDSDSIGKLSISEISEKIINILFNLEKSNYFPKKQRALLMSYIIEGFELLIETYNDKSRLIEFAKRHINSISPKTRKVANHFIKKYA